MLETCQNEEPVLSRGIYEYYVYCTNRCFINYRVRRAPGRSRPSVQKIFRLYSFLKKIKIHWLLARPSWFPPHVFFFLLRKVSLTVS